ncbi:YicC/YloC family endoribonuclease [Rhodoligotrophos defluvii]|uniref:YicC/YloC family endoribonuclease n=1 Tax=Rhodoligotrophos defluvii TaxID=2561934 RepID=UPI0010C9A55C|nr:YicC/YloC family endoribonuclease [Rhodoligotrophos defluvii]
MALTSMTGFARTDGAEGDLAWHWEIRSVNGRGLDIRLRLPQGLEALEMRIREMTAARLKRGNCQVSLTMEGGVATPEVVINEKALEAILAAMKRFKGKVSAEPPRLEALLGLRGVLDVRDPAQEGAASPAMLDKLARSYAGCLDALLKARAEEGAKLAAVVAEQVDRIEALATAARDCPARQPEAIRARLAEQVARLTDLGNFDPQRLHQEAVLLAARADIREELDRLFAHVAQARQLLAEGNGVGRRLDFLAQEFNREANTLCSKSNDKSLTGIGLELKAVIDQLREQVQNIE